MSRIATLTNAVLVLSLIGCGGQPCGDDRGSGAGGDAGPAGVLRLGLAVKANGVMIGYLVGDIGLMLISVYQPSTRALFDLNAITGHVCGNPFDEVGTALSGGLFYASGDCSGAPILAAGILVSQVRPTDPAPFAGTQSPVIRVGRADGDLEGWSAAAELLAESGAWECSPYNSSQPGGTCGCMVPNPDALRCENLASMCYMALPTCLGDLCYMEVSPSTIIAPSFPTPITVGEP